MTNVLSPFTPTPAEELRRRAMDALGFDEVRLRLAEHAETPMGRALVESLAPAGDEAAVSRLQDLTQEARVVHDRASVSLAGAKDILGQVERAGVGGALSPFDLLDVRDTLRVARTARGALLRNTEGIPGLAGIARGMPELHEVEEAINRSISGDGQVTDAASPRLRELRSERRAAHQRLLDLLNRIVRSPMGAQVLQEGLIMERNGRLVLMLKAEFRGRLPGIVHDVSDSGATLFVEPLAAVPVANRWREAQVQERREEERVLQQLSALVGDAAEGLRSLLEGVGGLDLDLSRGRYAAALKAVRPALLSGARPAARLSGARHPLLHPPVVPVDVHMGDDWTTLVITGPNAGGKTVSLKTLGLLVLMHQAGMQVPAGEGSALGVFDGVYADIGDQQSIERSLSTFTSHIHNLRSIMRAATERSLVLVDELGTSTDPEEGVALAKALLDWFTGRHIALAVTTHHREVAAFAQERDGMRNASVVLEPRTLAPTYHLTIGAPGRSYALAIARRTGLPAEVVDEAERLLPESHREAERLLSELHAETVRARAEREAATTAHAQAESAAREMEQRLEAVRESQVSMLEEARRQVEAEAEALRARLREVEKELGRAGRADLAQMAAQLGEVERELGRSAAWAAVTDARSWVAALRPGDRVQVRGVPQPAEVVSPPSERGLVEVQVGSMRMQVHQRQLEGKIEAATAAESVRPLYPRMSGVRVDAPSASRPVARELVLVGERVEPALERLSGYLHDAAFHGYDQVRVVHGAGTGALRRAVREFLAGHPEVARATPDPDSRGDHATLVELR